MVKLISQEMPPAVDSGTLGLPGMDPLFVLDSWSALSVMPQLDHERLSDHLAHQVSRSPGDLKTHTRRILFFSNEHHADGLFGALLDLFVVLGDKGLALRKRLLGAAAATLSDSQIEILRTRLNQGIHRFDALPPTQYSVLCQFLPQGEKLVQVTSAVHRQDSSRDPAEEARDLLEYGQVEEAQRLLEEAVLDSPLRLDLNEDLLEIYRYTQNPDDLFDMLARLGGRTTAIPEKWEAMIDHFDDLEAQKSKSE
jgi:hypothetical protein